MRPPPEVLVADDNPFVRDLLGRVLGGAGLGVWLVKHGQEAVRVYEQHRDTIRLVLLDVKMPVLGGPEAVVALRQLNPEVRVCFMTGDSGGYAAEDLLRMGVTRVFRKPFGDISVFAEEVRKLAG